MELFIKRLLCNLEKEGLEMDCTTSTKAVHIHLLLGIVQAPSQHNAKSDDVWLLPEPRLAELRIICWMLFSASIIFCGYLLSNWVTWRDVHGFWPLCITRLCTIVVCSRQQPCI